MGLLVGILIGLGGLSSDSELIAMNATGMGLRRLLVPVGVVVAVLLPRITLCMTLWLAPISVRRYPLPPRNSCAPVRLPLPFNPASSMSDFLTWCCMCRMFRPQPPTGVESSWWNPIRTMYRV